MSTQTPEQMLSEKTLIEQTKNRKQEHLDLCLNQNVESLLPSLWSNIQLPHLAAPEINFSEVSLETTFLGLKLKSPFLISSMTGGSPQGERINLELAKLSNDRGIAMGVGSQRVALENKDSSLFSLRKVAPNAILFANIGLVQMNYGVSASDCTWLVDSLQANALILHLNPLQEAIQSEGNRNFSKLLKHITELKKEIQVPIILKETGCGLDPQTAIRAKEAGVDALDTAGRGGTHWGYIEGLRNENRKELGEMFRDWGIESSTALTELRSTLGPNFPVIASGGIRNGLDAAKAIYLGADLVGMARPFLKVAVQGLDYLNQFLDLQEEALKIALFCTGSKNVKELKQA